MLKFSRKITEKFLLVFITSFHFFSSADKSFSQSPVRADSSIFRNSESLLFRTETRIFHSGLINQDFEIFEALPTDYFQSDASYPVLYCTDANRNFNLVSNIVNILNFPYREIPPILVVGIDYPPRGLEV